MSSLTNYDPNKNKPRIERRRYEWESEKTLVDERKKLKNRL